MGKKLIYLMIVIVTGAITVMFFINIKPVKQEVMYTEIEAKQFKDKIADEEQMIVYFGRDTCPACRKFNPILNEAINTTKKKNVFYLDCDNLQNRELAKLFDINETPTLVAFNGDSINNYIGLQDLDKTIEILSE